MGEVVVKYKVTVKQPDDGVPDYQQIADGISQFEEVQKVEIKPLAFGMMFGSTIMLLMIKAGYGLGSKI